MCVHHFLTQNYVCKEEQGIAGEETERMRGANRGAKRGASGLENLIITKVYTNSVTALTPPRVKENSLYILFYFLAFLGYQLTIICIQHVHFFINPFTSIKTQ